MPGPSFSPAFAAMGTFLLSLGLVFGGITLMLGAIALALTLLYWLAEGLRIYDHDLGLERRDAAGASSTKGRHPASTCPARRGGRSSGRSGCSSLFLGLVFGAGCWRPASSR